MLTPESLARRYLEDTSNSIDGQREEESSENLSRTDGESCDARGNSPDRFLPGQ